MWSLEELRTLLSNIENVKSILEKQILEAGFKKKFFIGEEFFEKQGEQFLVKVSFRDSEGMPCDRARIRFDVTFDVTAEYDNGFRCSVWKVVDSDDAKSSSCFNEKLSGVFQEIAKELTNKAQAALMTSVTGTLQ